jgi:hypothetical protein
MKSTEVHKGHTLGHASGPPLVQGGFAASTELVRKEGVTNLERFESCPDRNFSRARRSRRPHYPALFVHLPPCAESEVAMRDLLG